jgi:hypothetical protein
MGREMEQQGVPAEVANTIVDRAAREIVKIVCGVRP